MAKRMLVGLSCGKMPWKLGCSIGSLIRAVSLATPMFSWRSSNRILMKIRLADVVSSPLMWTAEKTCQPMESEARRWPKNLAMFRSLLVS
jgi:hypothetical protein